MSELEDPTTTLLRLITTRIRVVKDNGSVASILATKENYDRELLKEHDAQVTVGLDSSQDQKLELAGRLRRRNMVFRCNIFTVDKAVRCRHKANWISPSGCASIIVVSGSGIGGRW